MLLFTSNEASVYIYSLWLAYVLHLISLFSKGFLDDAVVKNSSANSGGSGEVGSIPGPGSSPREGNGSLLQYCCLENPMDKATWQAAAHWVTKSGHIWVAEHERTHTHTQNYFLSCPMFHTLWNIYVQLESWFQSPIGKTTRIFISLPNMLSNVFFHILLMELNCLQC